jgi:SAM-dependent methyltransferase
VSGDAAELYEQLFVPAIFGRWPPVLLDAAEVAPGDRVLDVGCGTGVLAASAHQRAGHDGWVVGLDPNEPMLTVARSRPSPVEWRSGAAEDIPYADGAFDRVVSQFALMYFADRSRGLAECARVTAPGGRVAIATWATLEDSPGYAALVDVAERTVGAEAVAALSAPFCLGDPAEVHALVAGAYADVEVRRHHGTATGIMPMSGRVVPPLRTSEGPCNRRADPWVQCSSRRTDARRTQVRCTNTGLGV